MPQAAGELPSWQGPEAEAQQPLGQLTGSQTQTSPRHRCPASQAGPVPQVQAPALEQPLARAGSQTVQLRPPEPQLASAGWWQNPPLQHPVGQVVGLQVPGASSRQSCEQPSPEVVLPSSQVSIPGRMTPSPHTAGAPRVSVTSTRCMGRTATGACCPLADTFVPARPSTRTVTVFPSRLAGSRMIAVSRPLVSALAGLGSVSVGNASASAEITEIASAVSCSSIS